MGQKGKSSHEFSDFVRKVVFIELGSEDLISSESEDGCINTGNSQDTVKEQPSATEFCFFTFSLVICSVPRFSVGLLRLKDVVSSKFVLGFLLRSGLNPGCFCVCVLIYPFDILKVPPRENYALHFKFHLLASWLLVGIHSSWASFCCDTKGGKMSQRYSKCQEYCSSSGFTL